MSKRRRYDYMTAVWNAAVPPCDVGDPKVRKVLRKLVREAVMTAQIAQSPPRLDIKEANRIAKELVP